jgi:hypothetical protein
MHLLQKIEGEVKVGFLTVSKIKNLVIENLVIEKTNGRGRFQSRKGIKCYYCDKPGHIQKDCRKYKRDKKGKDKDTNGENGTTAVVFDGCVNLVCQDTTWVADSTTFYHVTPQRDFFIFYTAGDFG